MYPLSIGQLYSYCPEAPNGRVKYVAHRASCYYFKKEEEAGGPRFKVNAVLKKKQVKLLGIHIMSYKQ